MSTLRNKILLIPGFGMEASFFEGISIKNWDVIIISPQWDNHNSWAELLRFVLSELNAELEQESNELVVYGFSIGADILMEFFNAGLLVIPNKARVVFAEPNIGKETCNITALASSCATYSEWKRSIQSRVNNIDDPLEKASWELYVDELEKRDWPKIIKFANEITATADDRFKTFSQAWLADRRGIRKTGVLALSKGVSLNALKKKYPVLAENREIQSYKSCPHFGWVRSIPIGKLIKEFFPSYRI